MTNAPADLLAFRYAVMAETGLTDPADVGIVGDGAHQHAGGYHEGRDVLSAIGAYHPSARAGSQSEDYSARLARDRSGLTDEASAMDIGADWSHGGRAAWLRFNDILAAALHSGDPALAQIRAVNYSPDGSVRQRIDRQYGLVVQSSSDSVDIHTHVEWYRDTAGRRQTSLDRIVQLIRAAIGNTTPPTPGGDTRMIVMAHEKGSNVDWIGDGVFRYQCPDAAHRANALVVMGLQGNPSPTSVEFNPGTLDALGPIVVSAPAGVPATVPPTAVTLTDADRQAIADLVSAEVGAKQDQALAAIAALNAKIIRAGNDLAV